MKTFQFLMTINLVLLSLLLKGQNFEIPIYFEDSMGNKDTIIFGYDIVAGYGIDSAFGEIDLLYSAYVKEFEVRASIYDYEKIREEDPRIIESKKMIIGYVCEDPNYFVETNSLMALIKCNNWPITIKWDKEKFQDTCNFMKIVDCTPGGWFDVCGGGHPYLQLEMKERDTVMYYDTEFKVEIEGDTMAALFFSFSDGIKLSVSDEPTKGKVIPYPNPVIDNIVKFKFENGPYNESTISVKIYNTLGHLISTSEVNEEITTQGWGSGLYLFVITDGGKILQAGKLLVVK
ncbi:MAG: T9SS type A sorting domain-containing protein [Saprospiraceae bacterium]